jgi:SPP1 gp7 family putative phage head morphogenesis protein
MASPLFTEAIEYAESRAVVLPDEYYGKLVGVQRSQAVSIAGLSSLEQIKYVIDLVAAALREGSTFADFKKKVAASEIPIDLPKHRLDNIFRTNIQVAYNRGRATQQKASSNRLYWMYDAVNDSRTRPRHLAMDNTVLSRDDPWWRTHYPPCGYRCRCVVISLTEKQALRRGIKETGPDVPPDEGWDWSPADDYGEGVRRGLENFGEEWKESNPRLASAAYRAKVKLKEEVDAAKGQYSDAPPKP